MFIVSSPFDTLSLSHLAEILDRVGTIKVLYYGSVNFNHKIRLQFVNFFRIYVTLPKTIDVGYRLIFFCNNWNVHLLVVKFNTSGNVFLRVKRSDKLLFAYYNIVATVNICSSWKKKTSIFILLNAVKSQ